jgi:hypothetical protein
MRPFSPLGIAIGIFALFTISGAVAFQYLRATPEASPVLDVAPEPQTQHREIGKSVEGRTIEAYTYGTGATHVLFVGGIHGGYEWNSVLLAYQFMDYFEANPAAVPKNISVTIVPNANPDGVFAVIGKNGRFTLADVPKTEDQSAGRFNANEVDLNRNFDCKWQPKSTWRSKTVSAGTEAFSEPEARAVRDLVLAEKPATVVFWHSQANAVYASECESGILPETLEVMNTYAEAANYPAVETFDSYAVTGDAEGWLASINIPAITVEMTTHESVEWDKNLAGVQALLKHFEN